MSTPAVGKSAASTHASLWRNIRHSLSGRRYDWTNEPLGRALLLLGVPMILELLMESLFALAALFWVARLGRDAVAVVGLTEALMNVIYAIATGFSLAAGAMVSRRIGEGDTDRASKAAAQVMLAGLMVSAVVGIALYYFAGAALELMGATSSVTAMGLQYTRIMLGCNLTVFMIFVINAIFRGAGDSVIAMRTLLLANVLNMGLIPLFTFGYGPFPEMGVTGAAVATNVGRGVGIVYQLYHLVGHHGRLRIRFHHLRPTLNVLRTILSTAASGIVQSLAATTSWLGLFKILAIIGSEAVAGFTIAVRINGFAIVTAVGLANACATLVGQNLGALKPERAEAAVRIALRYNVILLCAIAALLFVFSEPLARLFTTDTEVARHASNALQIVGAGLPLYGAAACLLAAFNGAGDTTTPTRLYIYCLWLGRIPLSCLFTYALGLGSTGVFIAVLLSSFALVLWSGKLFMDGKWKLRSI